MNDLLKAKLKSVAMRRDDDAIFGYDKGTARLESGLFVKNCPFDVDPSRFEINYLSCGCIEFNYGGSDSQSKLKLYPCESRSNAISNMHKVGVCVVDPSSRAVISAWMTCVNHDIAYGLKYNTESCIKGIASSRAYFKQNDVDISTAEIRIASHGILLCDPTTLNPHYCSIFIFPRSANN